MTWREIRAHYAALHAQARTAGATQKTIAARGGIAGQNSVSRVLSNDHLGPTVEIFVRAIEGLGKSVSQFFVELEQGAAATLEPAAAVNASVMDRLQRIEQALEALGLSSSSASPASDPGSQPRPGNRDGGSHGASSVSNGIVNHNHITTLDLQRVQAIVRTSTESILARLARLDAQMAELGRQDGEVPARKSAERGGSRRRRTATPT